MRERGGTVPLSPPVRQHGLRLPAPRQAHTRPSRQARPCSWERSGLALALMAGLAPAAVGQEVPFTPAATESCLAAAADLPGRRACIGEAADRCVDTPDGQTTVGMGFCYGAERDWWDARLNAAYGALMEMETGVEAELKEMGSAAPSPAAALREMERAWIAWRDAACEYEVSQWGGGTGGGPAWSQCTMEMTGEQALALEARLAARRAQ